MLIPLSHFYAILKIMMGENFMKKINWIMIANSNLARIYSFQTLNSHNSFNLVEELIHPQSRKRSLDLATDKPGSYKSGLSARGTYASAHEPKEVEIDAFATKLANLINKNRAANQFEKLIIVAPAHFYGLLGKHLNKTTKKFLKKIIQKDYTAIPANELYETLQEKIKYAA